MSCEAWVYLRSLSGGFAGLTGSWSAATPNRSWVLLINSNAWTFGTGNGTSQSLAGTGVSASLNVLTHLVGVKNNATNKLYVNGIEVASASTHAGSVTVGNNTTLIGALRTDDTLLNLNGQVFGVTCWDRELTLSEIKMLSSRRGIAYELAPRRRSSVQVITGNRRRRLLIGASS
jgi:hypothetical protein